MGLSCRDLPEQPSMAEVIDMNKSDENRKPVTTMKKITLLLRFLLHLFAMELTVALIVGLPTVYILLRLAGK
jgi:hypothetical protein